MLWHRVQNFAFGTLVDDLSTVVEALCRRGFAVLRLPDERSRAILEEAARFSGEMLSRVGEALTI